MSDQAKLLLEKGKPWRRGTAWWIIGVEGAILALVGLYFVLDPDGARTVVRQVFGWFLLVNSVLWAVAGIRASAASNPATPYRMLSAGIGLAVGALVVVEPLSEFIDEDAAKVILAFGLLGHGLIGLAGGIATRAQGGARRGPIIASLLYVAFAGLFFFNARSDTLDPRFFGYVAIAGGVGAIVVAYTLAQSARKKTEVTAGAPANPESDVPDVVEREALDVVAEPAAQSAE